MAKAQILGDGVPELAFEMNGPMSQIWVDPQGKRHRESPDGPPLPASLQASIRRSYYAAVSFVDFEVGRMLDQLDTLEVAATTAVLFHSDHGWKLGEHGAWSKCTNWELDARVPLIVRAPWLGAPAQGQATLALAELVDLYPTLVELSGLPSPPASEGIEGVSLVPALLRPDLEGAVGKVAAFSQYPRCTQYDLIKQAELWECLHIPRENFTRMGYSVRVADARYTEWRVWRASRSAPTGADRVSSQMNSTTTREMMALARAPLMSLNLSIWRKNLRGASKFVCWLGCCAHNSMQTGGGMRRGLSHPSSHPFWMIRHRFERPRGRRPRWRPLAREVAAGGAGAGRSRIYCGIKIFNVVMIARALAPSLALLLSLPTVQCCAQQP